MGANESFLALFTGLLPGRPFRAGHVGYGEYPPPVGLSRKTEGP